MAGPELQAQNTDVEAAFSKGPMADAARQRIVDTRKLDVRGRHLGPYCVPIATRLLNRVKVASKWTVAQNCAPAEHEQEPR